MLYCVTVGGALALGWWTTASGYVTLVAGLFASATVLALEIALRMGARPRVARRLGLTRPGEPTTS